MLSGNHALVKSREPTLSKVSGMKTPQPKRRLPPIPCACSKIESDGLRFSTRTAKPMSCLPWTLIERFTTETASALQL